MKRLDFAIDSDLRNVTLMAVAINRVCLELGFDAVRAGEIELCIVEGTTNAIQHAYQGNSGHVVAVQLSVYSEDLNIEVIDSGTPIPFEKQRTLFSGLTSPEPQTIDRQSLSEGGRGLQIIHELMDEVSYESGESHNRLIMRKRLIPVALDARQTLP